MRSNRFGRLARWGIGALTVLLVQSYAAPRYAWAGCNHLVTSRSDRLLDFNHLDAIVAGDPSSTISPEPAQHPLDPQSPGHRIPCSGPGCSDRLPMSIPSAFPESDRFDQWGVLVMPDDLPISSPPGRLIDEPTPHSTGQPSSIFHPPRG